MEKLLSRYFLILIIGFYSLTLLSQSEQVFINQDFEYRYQSLLSGKNVKSHIPTSELGRALYSNIKKFLLLELIFQGIRMNFQDI